MAARRSLEFADHPGDRDDRDPGRAHDRLGAARRDGRLEGQREGGPLHCPAFDRQRPLSACFLAGTIIYLVLTIKAINLNRRQSNFIDSVTHELKSPIVSSMKLYLQTLTRRQVSEEERGHFHACMIVDLDRLDALINQLLDAGRLEEGRIDADREDVSLDALLRDCASTVALHYRMAAEVFQFELQPCTIRAWRVDLDVLFRNLIDNAVKYADGEPHGGHSLAA